MKKIICVFCLITFLVGAFFFCSCADNRPIERYLLQISYQNGVVDGVLEYTFRVKDDNKILFNLYPNQMKNGSSLTVNSVFLEEKPCSFELIEDEAYLQVALPDECSDDEVMLSIDFSTVVAPSLSRLGKNDVTVNLAYFYPIACVYEGGYVKQKYVQFGDSFFSDFCDVEVRLTVPSVMSVACGFQPIEINVMGEKTEYRYQQNKTKAFNCSFSERYNIVSKKQNGRQVNYFYYNDNSPEERLQEIIDCLNFLRENIGEYPYPILTVAQSPYESAGMEYSAFCVVGECEKDDDYNYSIIHEVCHQYFPMSFLLNEYECGYFDEGLTEFLTNSYFEREKKGIKKAHAQYAGTLISAYNRAQNRLGNKYDGIMKKRLDAFSSKDEYVVTAYYKGYQLFYLIEKECGNILPYLKRVFNEYQFERLTEEVFISCFGAYKKTVQKIFDENVFKGEMITLD